MQWNQVHPSQREPNMHQDQSIPVFHSLMFNAITSYFLSIAMFHISNDSVVPLSMSKPH